MRQKPKNEASCENLESILFRQLQRVIRACDVIAPHSTARPAHLPASVSIGNQCNFVSSRMDSKHSLTEREMAQIARHQEFVYDVAMFAATCGFSWFNVIRAAVIAKDIFPQLDAGLDVPKLLSLLRDALSECLSNLTPVHRCEFTQFLTDTCITRRRLLQAAVGGAANMTITQLHLEVQLPPTPCPLEQGTDLHEWEHQRQQAELTSRLRQMEERLRSLREGSRVTLEDVDVPDDSQLDEAVRLTSASAGASKNSNVALRQSSEQEVM
ncbi:hypothetical protein FQN60_006656, partial [Etheostoma spectabile]